MEQLPIEMKQKIFGFLDKKDLLSAASTCKDLRTLILTSKRLMAYLNFQLVDFDAQKDYIAAYGSGLTRIQIGTEEPKKSIKMIQTEMKLMFRSIPNVQEMQINQVTPPATKKIIEDLELPVLKKLSFKNGGNNVKIFNFLHDCKVLEFTSSMDKIDNRLKSFTDDFWIWFNAQTKLKSVTFIGYAIHNFFNQIVVNDLKIKLKKSVFVCDLNIKQELNFDNFFEFLKQQDEIEEIILENFSDFAFLGHENYQKVVKQIFFGMQSLKTLRLKGSFGKANFPEVNLNLEKLVSNQKLFQNSSKHFPNIKNLKLIRQGSLDGFSIESHAVVDMKLLSQMPELEKLKIYDYSLIDSMERYQKFKKLQKLTLVACYLRSQDWKLLVTQTPLMEKLKLDMYQLSNDSLVTFIKWKKLKQLDLGFGFYQEELVHTLCQCPAFNHLKITKTTRNQFTDQLKNVDFEVEAMKERTDEDYKDRVDFFFLYYCTLIAFYQSNQDDLKIN